MYIMLKNNHSRQIAKLHWHLKNVNIELK